MYEINIYIGYSSGSGGFSGDGSAASSAQFSNVYGVSTDTQGNVYVSDFGNDRIRKITPLGIVRTMAGSLIGTSSCGFSGDGSAARNAQLCGPDANAIDSNGVVYIADSLNNCIRKVTIAGSIQSIAGINKYRLSIIVLIFNDMVYTWLSLKVLVCFIMGDQREMTVLHPVPFSTFLVTSPSILWVICILLTQTTIKFVR